MNKIKMEKLPYLLLILSMTSCISSIMPLKGSYISDKTFILNKPFEEAWSKCIDLIASKGFAINVIEKTSGLIVTDKHDFGKLSTYENAKGELENPSAYVVIDGTRVIAGSEIIKVRPNSVTGNWNIRLKKIDDNKTSITVNITNLTGNIDSRQFGMYNTIPAYSIPAYSTGMFETWVFEELKKELSKL